MAYWVGYGFTPLTGSKAWRIPVAIQAVFIVPILILVLIVPESPRWLASHGKADESLAVLARLQGKPATHSDVLAQHEEIQAAVQLETSIGSGNWSDLLKEDEIKSRRRLLIACSIQFFQQIGGINALIYYA
jgi:MFS family permease